MNKFRIAALQVLTGAGKPLHYKDITKEALDKGLLETDGAKPDATMNAQLAVEIKRLGESSDFLRTGPGVFGINPKKKLITPIKQKKVEEEEAAEEHKLILETGFTGKAGEHLVCSELLFRGFNSSIMSVDVGMDIIATKNGKLFSIQVKTANANAFNTYNFNVRRVSFERDHAGNTFYIFILRQNGKCDFLILPLSELEKKVVEKGIIYVASQEIYRLKIDVRDEKIYLGNRSHEMGYYKNNWDVIK